MTGRHFSQKCKPSKGQHFKDKKQNKISLSIILSVIALIEIILLMASVTFSWFEGLTSLQMEGKNVPTAPPLKSEFIVGEGPSYENPAAELNQFFEAQASAKFTPVSSFDGEHFYALCEGSASTYAEYNTGATNGTLKFRELSQEEINSNLLYFQFEVTANDADVDFWFKSLPTFKLNGNTIGNTNNPFRIRIDDGTGQTSSKEGNLIVTRKTSTSGFKAIKSINSNGVATLATTTTAAPLGNIATERTFGNNANNNGEKVLFTVKKGETKTITIAIWLEAFDSGYKETVIIPGSKIDLDIQFCSSWDVMDTITFRDYTAKQWVDSVNEDESNASQILGVVNLDSPSNYWYSGFKYNATTHQWTGEIPRAVQNIKFIWQTAGDTTQTEDAKWTAPTRGSKTTFTAFGSSAGLWYDGEVERIGLSDLTTTKWLNNNSAKMKVNVNYSGYNFNYSMTDTPSLLDGENTWYCFIPSDLDEVRFNRYEDNTLKNYWLGPNRGTETIYYALESGVEIPKPEETGTTVYLRIPKDYENQFFDQNLLPAVSKMSQVNIDLVEALGSNKQNLAQNGGYCVDGSAHADTWLGDQGRMTKIPTTDGSHLYSFHFDEELADGTYLTFWNKPQVNYRNLDNRTCIAPLIQYNSSKNVFILNSSKQLTNGTFNNAWIYEGIWINEDIDDSTTGGTTTTQPEYQTGRWGKPTKPNGTYTTFFVPPTGTTPSSVTATFIYENEEHFLFPYSVTLTDSNGDGIFETNGIPDSVTSITFSDGTNTWNAGSGRTSTNCYFVCSSTSAGTWKSTGTTAMKTIYLRPTTKWDVDNAWFWVHAWGGAGGDFDAKMTEGTDGLYSVQIPEDSTQIIFVRMDPAYTDMSWDPNSGLWKQTVDLTIPSDSDTFTITSSTNGTWHYVEPTETVIYVNFANAGSNWGSGHYLSVTSSSNSGKNMNQANTSGAGSYVPKNDTWIGSGTLVSGKTYKWVIPEAQLNNLKNYGFTVWSVNESGYEQVWSVDVSHVAYSTTYNTYTISSSKTTHNDRQADCFTLTPSSNTN